MSILQSSHISDFSKGVNPWFKLKKLKLIFHCFWSTFFNQKHGLTPLEKCDFLGLWKITFFMAKQRFLFYLAHYLTLFLVLFWPKTTQEIKSIFWPKAWVNPFGKMRFLRLRKIDFLWPKKVSFLSRTLLNIISSHILTENN